MLTPSAFRPIADRFFARLGTLGSIREGVEMAGRWNRVAFEGRPPGTVRLAGCWPVPGGILWEFEAVPPPAPMLVSDAESGEVVFEIPMEPERADFADLFCDPAFVVAAGG